MYVADISDGEFEQLYMLIKARVLSRHDGF